MLRLVFLIVGFAVLVSSLAPSPTARTPRAWLLLAAGLLAAALAVYRMESPPTTLDISIGPLQVPAPPGTGSALGQLVHVHAGPWLALLGGVLVMLGAWAQLPSARTVSARVTPAVPAPPASKAPPGASSA